MYVIKAEQHSKMIQEKGKKLQKLYVGSLNVIP